MESKTIFWRFRIYAERFERWTMLIIYISRANGLMAICWANFLLFKIMHRLAFIIRVLTASMQVRARILFELPIGFNCYTILEQFFFLRIYRKFVIKIILWAIDENISQINFRKIFNQKFTIQITDQQSIELNWCNWMWFFGLLLKFTATLCVIHDAYFARGLKLRGMNTFWLRAWSFGSNLNVCLCDGPSDGNRNSNGI